VSASCAQADPAAWFPEPFDTGTRNMAKSICEHCHLRVECLAACFELDGDHGVWGGVHERYRSRNNLHAIFRRGGKESLEFAREVIAAYDEKYGLPSENARKARLNHQESHFQKLENERNHRAEVRERLRKAS
jgi:hypothetical protein